MDAIHVDPPTSPSRLIGWPSARLYVVLALFAALAVAAKADGGAVLLSIDEPIERFVVTNREAWVNTLFRSASLLGSTPVVLAGGAVLAALALPRCRAVAVLAVVATATRPLVEFSLKQLVGRDRPELDRLVNGEGPAFPSGHVMAGATLWMLVPTVVALYVPSRRVWWGVAGGCVAIVALIGASRVYLGVHWATDVVGGTLVALALLAGLDAGFRRVHRRNGCVAT